MCGAFVFGSSFDPVLLNDKRIPTAPAPPPPPLHPEVVNVWKNNSPISKKVVEQSFCLKFFGFATIYFFNFLPFG